MFEIIQDKRNTQNYQKSSIYHTTSHSSKKKKDDSLNPLKNCIPSIDIAKKSNSNNNNNSAIEELLVDMPIFPNNHMIARSPTEKLSLYPDDDQDLGFDFEESHEQVITNFHDLPVQCDLSDDSSIDSFIVRHTNHHHHQQQEQEDECQLIKGEVSICSTLDSFSEDDDEESMSYPTPSSSSYLLNKSCIRNHDTQQQQQQLQQQQQQPSLSKTSSISPPLPMTKITSILNPKKDDKYNIPKRSVSFSPCLVTEIHTMPRRTCQEWHRCYYTAHELQRMLDEKDDAEDEWMDFQQTGHNGWGMQPGRQLVITAQEEDDILEF